MSQRAYRQAPRLIVANLDCEADFAAAVAPRGRTRPTLSRAAHTAAAEAGTLLRVFAAPGDVLLLPAAIDPARLVDLPGLPRPALRTEWPQAVPGAVLAWGETARVARLRPPGRRGGAAIEPIDTFDFDAPLHRVVWRLPAPSPAAAAAANGKSQALATAAALGRALPGARVVASEAELEAAVADGALAGRPFVLKAEHGAAGRWRYVHREPAGPLPRRRIARLLAAHGPLLLEPWLARDLDVGAVALLGPTGLRPLGFHRQRVDREGRFLALDFVLEKVPGTLEKVPDTLEKVPDTSKNALEEHDVPGNVPGGVTGMPRYAYGETPGNSVREEVAGTWDDLEEAEGRALERALAATAETLRGVGYVGPFGIDAWRYRHPDGTAAFHPLGEINARMSFGLVARALVERLRGPLGWTDGARIALCFGRALPKGSTHKSSKTVPLLRPAGAASRAIWLEMAC